MGGENGEQSYLCFGSHGTLQEFAKTTISSKKCPLTFPSRYLMTMNYLFFPSFISFLWPLCLGLSIIVNLPDQSPCQELSIIANYAWSGLLGWYS